MIHALAAACTAFYLINVVRWHKLKILRVKQVVFVSDRAIEVNKPILDRKPFSCTVCLSAWFGLANGLLNGFGWHSIEIMFIAGVMGLILDNGLKRYL